MVFPVKYARINILPSWWMEAKLKNRTLASRAPGDVPYPVNSLGQHSFHQVTFFTGETSLPRDRLRFYGWKGPLPGIHPPRSSGIL